MKKIYKVMIALGALTGMLALAFVWLVRGAIGVADDVADTAAHTIDSAVAKVKEADSEVQPPAPDDKGSLAQIAAAPSENTAPGTNNRVENADISAASPAKPQNNGSDIEAPKTVSRGHGKDTDDDTLVSAVKILGFLMGDDDAADMNPTDILNSDDKTETAADKQTDKETDKTGLAGIVPSVDSPTLQKIWAGKYKGKEDQIIDDALEDPKAWRLLFFLGGGM